eukprot:gene4362-6170_t
MASSILLLPPIRFIDFNVFSRYNSFPRYPDQNEVTLLDDIDRNNALVVFISHCWLRGHKNAIGYDGRPHPDTNTSDKFKLCVEGLDKVWKSFAMEMRNCYVWIDFGCIDQDANPAAELKQLDVIIQSCDLIFTPIFDPQFSEWQRPTHTGWTNVYSEYRAGAWNDGEHAYMNRCWCRIEMFFAANIPLINSSNRLEKFKFGLHVHQSHQRRPHMLYGTRESHLNIQPLVLPPLQNSIFKQLHPNDGFISFPSDRIKIEELVNQLLPIMVFVQPEYVGDLDNNGLPHGVGKMIYDNSNGEIYFGEFYLGMKHGKGEICAGNGSKYVGDWMNDKKHGFGILNHAFGDTYEGEFYEDKRNGIGKLTMANGDIYDGNWTLFFKNGTGKYFKYSTSEVFNVTYDMGTETSREFVSSWNK